MKTIFRWRYLFGLIVVALIALRAVGVPFKLTTKEFWSNLDPQRMNPELINTWGWEDSPYVTEDGQDLYFMYTPWNFFPIFSGGTPVKIGPDRKGHISDEKNPWHDSNMYHSVWSNEGKWSVPQHVDFADKKGGCCAMVSADGKTMYLGRGNQVGPENKMDVYVARRTGENTWSAPENIGPPVNTEAAEDNPHISWDGNSLYFASDRPGSTGGKDLYVSKRTASGWGEPQKIAPNINSGDEDQIWVSKDEKQIYFGRQNTPTFLGSRFAAGKWSDPEPFVAGTKAVVGELSLSLSGTRAYYAIVDFERKDIILSMSVKQPDGRWSDARSMDEGL